LPYIKQEMRKEIDGKIETLMHAIDSITIDNQLDGCLNYVFTKMLKHFYTDGIDQGGIPMSNYYRLNRAVGLVECVKTEFERKVVAQYEDQKEFENGSV